MEEILASIRKIIADDQTKAPAAAAPVAAPAPAPVAPPPPPVAVAPAPKPVAPVEDDILDLGREAMTLPNTAPKDDMDLLFEQPIAPKPVVEEPVQAAPVILVAEDIFEPAPEADLSSLLSNQASSSVSSAFGSLAHTVLSQNARTVDDLVKEMLKPLLKGWLDDNLPTMVERLVRAEIERVARGGPR